jgi:ferritin-like protein
VSEGAFLITIITIISPSIEYRAFGNTRDVITVNKTTFQGGHTMARVAREMVEKAGVNLDQLLELLVKNAAAELTTYYYYTILRVNLIGLEGEGIKEIAEVARIEDRNHFEALVPRIYELGGKLPEDMKAFHDASACPPASLPKDPKNIQAMLKVLVEAERCAVRGYTHICNMTAGKDHRTYDLALAILNEEIEHESWFSEFLGEGPSGHFMRRGDTSPFVSKFLK